MERALYCGEADLGKKASSAAPGPKKRSDMMIHRKEKMKEKIIIKI